MLGDADEVGGGGRLQENLVAVCPHCGGVVLTRTQDPYGRPAVTCQRCCRRIEPAMVPVEEHRGEWGDGYTLGAYSMPTAPRRERPRSLRRGDIVGAVKASQNRPERRQMDALAPQERPTRPT